MVLLKMLVAPESVSLDYRSLIFWVNFRRFGGYYIFILEVLNAHYDDINLLITYKHL
jgi:hypothetical protein